MRRRQAVRLRSDHGVMVGRLKEAAIVPGNLEVHWPEGNVLLSERIDLHQHDLLRIVTGKNRLPKKIDVSRVIKPTE